MSLGIQRQIVELLRNNRNRNIAIVMHNNPDGDCVGSAVALEEALKQIGKRVDIILHNKISKKFSPIIGENRVERFFLPFEGKRYDITFMLDVSDYNRTYHNIKNISKNIVTIDHHMNQKSNSKYYLNDFDASTGITVYKLIKNFARITPSISTAIYLTIRHDTGNFKNNSTTSNVHILTGELLLFGADIKVVNEIYDDKSREYMELLSSVLKNINYEKNIAHLVITSEDLKRTSCTMKEAGYIIDIMKTIKGIDVSVLVVENNGNVIVKSRSKKYDIVSVVQKYGGGGHKCAAGALIKNNDNAHQICYDIVQAIKDKIK